MSDVVRVGIVDCETTGISARDEPISIGAVVVDVDISGAITPVLRWHGMQAPSVPISPQAEMVHGLTIHHLDGKRFNLDELRDVLGQCRHLVAHNASFDARMIGKVAPWIVSSDWRCSYRQWVWPALDNKKLDTVCGHFSIDRACFHDALGDCEALLTALSMRTGKTARSSTYMKKLIAKPSFPVAPRNPPPTIEEVDAAREFAIRFTAAPPQDAPVVFSHHHIQHNIAQPTANAKALTALVVVGAVCVAIAYLVMLLTGNT